MITRLLYLTALLLPFTGTLYAQAKNWIGTTDEWGLPENWNPNGIPTSVNSVSVSAGAPNWPKLSGPVEVGSFTMNAGSQLDVNGHKLTSLGVVNLTEATVNNSATGPALIETNGGTSHLRNSVFATGLDFTATGSAVLNEADATGPNTYNGNVKITMAGSGGLNFSGTFRSVVNGDLTIERTVGGTTNLFTSTAIASTAVTGDFSYTNKVGGVTVIGSTDGKTIIAGKLYIDSDATGSPTFTLRRLTNNITGGEVTILNPGEFNLLNDTLTVASFTVTGKKFGNSTIDLNKLTFGSFLYEDDPGNNAVTRISRSEFNGATTFTQYGYSSFDEGWGGPNTYNGNTVFNGKGIGVLNISGWSRSLFNGNLTVARTAPGATNVFASTNAASVAVTGNFNYTNDAGGASTIGSTDGKAIIEGKIDMEVSGGSNPVFTLRRIANNTTGGEVTILNPGEFNLLNDTLTVASFTVTGKKFGNSTIDLNKLTFGSFLYEDDPGNNAVLRISRSEFNGATTFTQYGYSSFDEGWGGPNTYNGNTVFNGKGTGVLNISGWSRSLFNGNLTVARTAPGATNVFASTNAASVAVTGNFNYTNDAGGASTIGSTDGKAIIEGKIDMEVSGVGNPVFTLRRIANNTSGGNISILSSGELNLLNDTLTVESFTVFGKKFGNSTIDLNKLTFGSFLYEDDPANNAVTRVSGNEFNGPATFTLKGNAPLDEGWGGPNTYNGNTVFNGKGTGVLNISGWSRSLFNGNLTVARTAPGATNVFASTNAASVAVTGNFNYTNDAGGASTIGSTDGKAIIEGKIDMEVSGVGNPVFTLRRIANNTSGGNISILSSGELNLLNDTLTVESFTVFGKKFGNSTIDLNKLTFGSFLYEDDPANNGVTRVSGNEFNGSAAFTLRGIAPMEESWNGSNQFNGNVTYTRTGSGNIVIGHSFVSSYAADLTFASAAGITVNAPGRIRFNGATDGTFTQAGVAEPVLPGFILEKTGGAKLVLSQPLRTSNTVSFVSGYIEASEASPMIFQAGTGYTGAADESHVIGPVHKIGNTEFIFPIGSGEKLFIAGIGAPSAPADRFSAEFLAYNPGDDGYDPGEKAGTLTKVFDGGYWDIQPVEPTVGNVTITLGYNFPSGYITNASKLAVAHWNGGLWNDLGNGGTSGSTTVGTVSTEAAVPAFSPFTIASTEDTNPLPVVLAGFSVSGEGTATVLHWTTTDEVNSERFETEHSTDARTWRTTGAVTAKKERNAITNYTYIHTNPFTGINYYRLKMVDLDGSYTYSKIESLVFSGETVSILYPNPVSDRVFIKAGGKVQQVEVIDLLGRTVQSASEGLNDGLDVSRLVPGLYQVKVILPDGSTETLRLAIAR